MIAALECGQEERKTGLAIGQSEEINPVVFKRRTLVHAHRLVGA